MPINFADNPAYEAFFLAAIFAFVVFMMRDLQLRSRILDLHEALNKKDAMIDQMMKERAFITARIREAQDKLNKEPAEGSSAKDCKVISLTEWKQKRKAS